jgi:hypothetical protein
LFCIFFFFLNTLEISEFTLKRFDSIYNLSQSRRPILHRGITCVLPVRRVRRRNMSNLRSVCAKDYLLSKSSSSCVCWNGGSTTQRGQNKTTRPKKIVGLHFP